MLIWCIYPQFHFDFAQRFIVKCVNFQIHWNWALSTCRPRGTDKKNRTTKTTTPTSIFNAVENKLLTWNFWFGTTKTNQRMNKKKFMKTKKRRMIQIRSVQRIWRKELYNNQAHTNAKIMIAPFLSCLENILFNEIELYTHTHDGKTLIIHSIHARSLAVCRPSLSFDVFMYL